MSEPENPTPEVKPTPPAKQPAPPEEKTFTQAELDSIVGNRAKEARQSAVNDLLKDLGFEKADELKTMIADAKKRQEDEMSEAEKANQLAEREKKRADELAAQLESEKQARLIDRRNNAIIAAAAKAHNAKDVIRWAEDDGKELLAKVVSEDGTVDDKAAKALVDACQKAMPHYFGATGPGSPSNRDGKPPSADADRIKQVLEQRPKVRL